MIAVCGAAYSVYTDIRSRVIKNWITFPLILLGWSMSLYTGGWKNLILMIGSSVLVGVICLILSRHALKPGDIKLLVGIAACLQNPTWSFFLIPCYFMTALGAMIINRLRIHHWNPIRTMQFIKLEFDLSFTGTPPEAVHGKGVYHSGAPSILASLIILLVLKGVF